MAAIKGKLWGNDERDSRYGPIRRADGLQEYRLPDLSPAGTMQAVSRTPAAGERDTKAGEPHAPHLRRSRVSLDDRHRFPKTPCLSCRDYSAPSIGSGRGADQDGNANLV